jgi:alpha-beta hydrolase superfamily lysophospholipase
VRLVLPVALIVVLAAPASAGVLDRAAVTGGAAKCKRVVRNGKRVRVCPKPKPLAHSTRRIDVGGYRLLLECWGSGRPTVVLDSGFSTSRTAWSFVQKTAGRTTRTCSYDRAGLGQSDPRPGGAATTRQVVDELHTLLTRAGIAGPYVLSGWSIGGFDVRYYTLRYPQDSAGLVLVDATPEGWIVRASLDPLTSPLETMHLQEAAQALAADGDLGSRPVVALTHGQPELDPTEEAFWLAEQKHVASKSSNAWLVRARFSGHAIATDQPRLVIEAIKRVVASVRRGAALPACSASPVPKLGGTCLALTQR